MNICVKSEGLKIWINWVRNEIIHWVCHEIFEPTTIAQPLVIPMKMGIYKLYRTRQAQQRGLLVLGRILVAIGDY
jgi:hypothetical protein